MLRAEVRLVWLWGEEGWRWWYAQDFFRDTLEDLGAGLGLTDPVSGEVVWRASRPA